MATTIVTKNSSTASAVPTAGQLVQGELAVNVADKKLYTEDNAGSIIVLADGVKLAGIEALADVTDTANVTAAGALMDSELTNITAVKALNQGVATTDSPSFVGLTASGEITANGGIALGDNDKATFGAGDDLQIYHDGSNSYIRDTGTGNLNISADQLRVLNAGNNEIKAEFTTDGAVDLYHNNALKLATTATGIDVTGTVTADGGLGLGAQGKFSGWSPTGSTSPAHGAIELGSTASYQGIIAYDGSSNTRFFFDNSWSGTGSTFEFRTNTAATAKTHLKVEGTGDISFYEDTGTTPKFVWSASAESLGIGTSSPAGKIDLGGNSAGTVQAVLARGVTDPAMKVRVLNGDSGTTASQGSIGLDYADGTWANMSTIKFLRNNSAGLMAFYTSGSAASGTERMRIDSSGNLLVGKIFSDLATVGQELKASGASYFTRSAATPVFANRLSTDGSIIDFHKDGTTVGSIGVAAGNNLYIGSSATDHTGLIFPDNAILPAKELAAIDAFVDLGSTTRRFKDLYLSGGVYLGGTGAANLLDDYEEGTWTPNQGAGLTVVGAFQSEGYYTKIGNLVTISGFVGGATSVTCSAGGTLCTNAIFTSAAAGVLWAGSVINWNADSGASCAVQQNTTNVYNGTEVTTSAKISFCVTYRV
jgi:hypothetical protein